MDPSLLLPPHWESHELPRWFEEDFPSLDVSSCIVGNELASAKLILKSCQTICLAGKPFVDAIFSYLHGPASVCWHFSEGQEIQGPAVVATLQGPAPVLLRGERVALNVLARCSSIATYARYVQTLTPCRIAGTRKTTPGFRLVEKYGLAVGGVDIHRTAVSGGCIMIKDNHVELCGGDIKMALERIRTFKSFTAKIEVECHDMQQASTAASNGADIVMLDNFIPSIDQLHSLKNAHPNLEIELSGGITPQTIHQYPQDPNIILSLGALTHSAPHLDFSFKIRAIDQ